MKSMYSSEEADILHQLDDLFNGWEKEVIPSEDKKNDYFFIQDGFYPNYLKQRPRILYIGRDAHDLYDDTTYIEKFLPQYLSGRMGDAETNINGVKFHKLLIKVAYGIIHECNWNQSTDEPSKPHVPAASVICGVDEKVFDRVSFAFMNLCKWSHDDKIGADWTAIDEFVEKSVSAQTNYFLDEISLLSPDIIISMNFGPELISRFTSRKFQLVDDKTKTAAFTKWSWTPSPNRFSCSTPGISRASSPKKNASTTRSSNILTNTGARSAK